jgi:inorganic pyrophosphatase
VPQTIYADGDPLDIMALSFAPLTVGTVAKVRVIGVLEMEDEEGQDSKILSVLASDRRFEGFSDLGDVQKHQLIEIVEFFETYKRLQPCSWVKVKGWQSREQALKDVEKAIADYRKLPDYKEAITPD